jgi:hypothetical protein
MKSIILFLVLISFTFTSISGQEDFKVIKVNGTIVLKTKGISLETGTVFSEKEDLLFRSEDATAAVINSQKGRLIITSKNHNLSAARSNSLPSMYNVSTRSTAISGSIDPASIFSGRYVILNRQNIKLDKEDYPMDKDHFFFLRYIYKGEEINKKLDFSADTLTIDKSTLLTVDGKPIPGADNTSIMLFYRKGNESVFISQFDLIFPDMKLLAKETEIILSEIKEKSNKDKIAEVGSYINEFYGKPQKADLENWLGKSFGIK